MMAHAILGKRAGLLCIAMLAACTPGGAGADAAANMAGNASEADAAAHAGANVQAGGGAPANAAQASSAPADGARDCRTFLVGVWTVRGPHELLGETRELDYRYDFRADGRYDTNMRYRNPGADWTDHRMSGTWRAAPPAGGGNPDACELVMEVVGDGFSSSGTSEVVMVGSPDGLDFGMGVVLRRDR